MANCFFCWIVSLFRGIVSLFLAQVKNYAGLSKLYVVFINLVRDHNYAKVRAFPRSLIRLKLAAEKKVKPKFFFPATQLDMNTIDLLLTICLTEKKILGFINENKSNFQILYCKNKPEILTHHFRNVSEIIIIEAHFISKNALIYN